MLTRRFVRTHARGGGAAGALVGRSGSGFTLIETSLALVIVGVGVLALIDAQQSFIRTNGWSSHAATATYLANEIREMTRRLPRHDPTTGLYFIPGAEGAQELRGWGPETGEVEVNDFDDLDDFDGLSLAFNGTAGLDDGDLVGPVDAFGEVIPQVTPSGEILRDQNGVAVPLEGWSQVVAVEKVDPTNYSTVYPSEQVLAADAGGFNGLAVDRFPLRVTVTVSYRGPFDAEAQPVAVVTWIVP